MQVLKNRFFSSNKPQNVEFGGEGIMIWIVIFLITTQITLKIMFFEWERTNYQTY